MNILGLPLQGAFELICVLCQLRILEYPRMVIQAKDEPHHTLTILSLINAHIRGL